MEKKKYIVPETTCFPLGGIRLLDSISVDPSMQGYQQDAEADTWTWEEEYNWPHLTYNWEEE